MLATTSKVSALILLATFAVAARAEDTIPIEKVPSKVMKAVKAKFPGAEATGAAREEEKGKTTYEVMIKHKGAKVDVSVSEAGEITSYEKKLDIDDLPKPVVAAVMKKYPGAKITAAEELFKDDASNYEVAVAVKGKKSFEMIVSAKGKVVEDEGSEKDDK